MGIEPALLTSVDGLKQSTLVIRPRIHTSNRNNGKYVAGGVNSFITHQKIIYELQKLESRVSTVHLQLKFDETQNVYLTQTLVFFIRS